MLYTILTLSLHFLRCIHTAYIETKTEGTEPNGNLCLSVCSMNTSIQFYTRDFYPSKCQALSKIKVFYLILFPIKTLVQVVVTWTEQECWEMKVTEILQVTERWSELAWAEVCVVVLWLGQVACTTGQRWLSCQLMIFFFSGCLNKISILNTNSGWPRHRGKQGIWFLLFPDRENTGNFVLTQGKIC